MKTIDINQLPQDVQDKVRNTCSVYNQAYVEYENGQYTARVGVALTSTPNAPDFALYEIKKEDVFTPEEIAANRAELDKPNADGSHWTDRL